MAGAIAVHNFFCHRANGAWYVDRDTANGKPPGLMRMDRLAATCSGETACPAGRFLGAEHSRAPRRMTSPRSQTENAGVPPWVIVAGGFHQAGGMDRPTAALATHLCEPRSPVSPVRLPANARPHPNSSVTP